MASLTEVGVETEWPPRTVPGTAPLMEVCKYETHTGVKKFDVHYLMLFQTLALV